MANIHSESTSFVREVLSSKPRSLQGIQHTDPKYHLYEYLKHPAIRKLAEARYELYVKIKSKSWRLTSLLRMMATLIQTSSVWTKLRGNRKS